MSWMPLSGLGQQPQESGGRLLSVHRHQSFGGVTAEVGVGRLQGQRQGRDRPGVPQ